MKHLKENKLLKQKRTWIIIGAVSVAALGAGFVVAGVTSQQGVFTTTDQQQRDVQSLAGIIFGTDPGDKRLLAIQRLSELDLEGNCRGEWWNGWQQSVLPSVKDKAARCEQQQQGLRNAIVAARQFQEFSQYDKAIAQQIATLSIDTTKQNWQQTALKSAQEARVKIKGIQTPKNGKAAQKVVLDRLEAIISSWSALSAASVKQDKTAYLNAEGELKQAYANLGAIADASDAGISTSVNLLKEEIDKL